MRLWLALFLTLIACDPVRNAAGVAPPGDDDDVADDDDATGVDDDDAADDDDTPDEPPYDDDDDTPIVPPDDDDLIDVGVVFEHTGDVQYFEVPWGVELVEVTLYGASGGDSETNTYGGRGGTAWALVEVVPGELLEVWVGGEGLSYQTEDAPGGFNGGGGIVQVCCSGSSGTGGGATDLRRGSGLEDRLVVAGGGGGGGWSARDGQGGAGGGFVGWDGTSNEPDYPAGGGGLSDAGGLVGWTDPAYPNTAGEFGLGGTCYFDGAGCGGGGGGLFGGGTGGFAGGGGGSGYASGPGVTSLSLEPDAWEGPGLAYINF
jgi:hypothetical protein